MTHSGDTSPVRDRPIIIYPVTVITQALPPSQVIEVLDWFRANGLDPNGISTNERVEISNVIDFWWIAVQKQPDPEWPTLEAHHASGEPSRSHHQVEITVELPEHLASLLRQLQDEVEGKERDVEAALTRAGIHRGRTAE